jgi:hypothetical protein
MEQPGAGARGLDHPRQTRIGAGAKTGGYSKSI